MYPVPTVGRVLGILYISLSSVNETTEEEMSNALSENRDSKLVLHRCGFRHRFHPFTAGRIYLGRRTRDHCFEKVSLENLFALRRTTCLSFCIRCQLLTPLISSSCNAGSFRTLNIPFKATVHYPLIPILSC